LIARAKWSLSQILEAGQEASELQAEAMEYLHSRLGTNLPEDKDLSTLFDCLVIYWSR
jgi:hypothetical protein